MSEMLHALIFLFVILILFVNLFLVRLGVYFSQPLAMLTFHKIFRGALNEHNFQYIEPCAIFIARYLLRATFSNKSFRHFLRLKVTSLKNHNFSKCVIWSTGEELFQQKSSVLFSRHSSFCIFNHSMIYQICDIMMSKMARSRYIVILIKS